MKIKGIHFHFYASWIYGFLCNGTNLKRHDHKQWAQTENSMAQAFTLDMWLGWVMTTFPWWNLSQSPTSRSKQKPGTQNGNSSSWIELKLIVCLLCRYSMISMIQHVQDCLKVLRGAHAKGFAGSTFGAEMSLRMALEFMQGTPDKCCTICTAHAVQVWEMDEKY